MQNNTPDNDPHIYKGNTLQFRRLSRIDKGGNGEIFRIEIVNRDKSQDFKCVAKFIKKTYKSDNRRVARFNKEISETSKICKTIQGILPVVDYSLIDLDDEFSGWYIMPRAKSVERFFKPKSKIPEKIEFLLSLAAIIRDIHNSKRAHRDIKPANILLYNGKIHLCDFGLVYNPELPSITGDHEVVGPYYFLAPEMKTGVPNSANFGFVDYCRMDIYSFAKVVWSIFNSNYKKTWPDIECNKICFQDFKTGGIERYQWEPIFQLLEACTKYDPFERMAIDDCIKKLSDFKLCIDKEFLVIAKYKRNYLDRNILEDNNYDSIIYKNIDIIIDNINLRIDQYYFRWEDTKYRITSSSRLGEHGLVLSTKFYGKTISYCFFPSEFKVGNINNEDGSGLSYSLETKISKQALNEEYAEYKEMKPEDKANIRFSDSSEFNFMVNRAIVLLLVPIQN